MSYGQKVTVYRIKISYNVTYCRHHYTYPLITRVRRGVSFADILKALSFHLGIPKFDWSKTVGSKKIGASFGFREENFVDLQLGIYYRVIV